MVTTRLQHYFESGILLINKQAGRTSSDQVQDIVHACRRSGFEVKAGHSGTLDTKVTGLLVIGLGKGTKVLEFMLESEKVYIGELLLHRDITREQLVYELGKFTGAIMQLPPQRSSVKRVNRARTVYELTILDFTPRRVLIYCAVERGTYIRKLFHDIGVSLGVGAHMGDLHRISVGPFKKPRMISTVEFSRLLKHAVSNNPFLAIPSFLKLKIYLFDINAAFSHMPRVKVQSGVEKNILLGNNLFIPGTQSIPRHIDIGDRVVISSRGKVLALGELVVDPQYWKRLTKGIAVKNLKVLGKLE